MRQYGTPVRVVLPADQGLNYVLDKWIRSDPSRLIFSRKTATGWQDVRYQEFTDDVRRLAKSLIAMGISNGDRVVILGRTSYEWVVADFAVLSLGAVSVPIYPTASEQQIRHVVKDSGAAWCFAELPEHCDMLREVGGWSADVWSFDSLLGELADRGADVPDAALAERTAAVRADDLATIVYTSGTTGLPKGCMLTHQNFFTASANTVEHCGTLFTGTAGEPARTLMFLPFSHVYGRTILIACLWGGTHARLLAGVPEVMEQLAAFQPTFVATVPYALEKIRKGVRAQVPAGLGARMYDAAERTAIAYGHAVGRGEEPDPGLAAVHAVFDDAVYGALRAGFGGQWRYAICGGASLDPSTGDFYAGIGVTILGGYGLTETATATTVNEPVTNRLGTSGPPIPGVTVAIADDDEVLVAGPNVSSGYWPGDISATEDIDGVPWLHTGDLGRLDDDGYLSITGRRKEILVTSGGKNVSPTLLEDRVRLHRLVSNCMVVGDGRTYVTALVTLDEPALREWSARTGMSLDGDGWRQDPRLVGEVQTAIDDANSLVSRAESIRRFRVVAGDFAMDKGQLTPSLKLRRDVIERDYEADVAELYA